MRQKSISTISKILNNPNCHKCKRLHIQVVHDFMLRHFFTSRTGTRSTHMTICKNLHKRHYQYKHYSCNNYYSTTSTILQQQKGDEDANNKLRNSFHFINHTNDGNKTTDLDITHSSLSSSPSTFQSNHKNNISHDKINTLTSTIDIGNIPIGSLEHAQIRQACQMLHSMAHFNVIINNYKNNNGSTAGSQMKKNEQSTATTTTFMSDELKGDYVFQIFKRLLLEIGCEYQTVNNNNDNSNTSSNEMQFVIHGKINHQNPKSLHLDSKVFHDVIKCLFKSQNITLINHAKHILHQLEEHYLETKSKTLHPTGRSYALLFDVMKNYNEYKLLHYNSDSEEDTTYNTSSKLQSDNVETQIQQLMERIWRQQNEGNPQVVMNSHLYNSALDALAHHSENNPNASQLLQKMMIDDKAELDHVSYSIAIKSLLSNHKWLDIIDTSNGITTAKAIESLLVQMKHRGLGNPSAKTMTPILQALSKEGNASEISNLIEWMEDMYQTWKWEDIRPNNYHFNTMITALARKNSDGKVRSGSGHLAIEILNKMKSLYEEGGNHDARPDVITYNAVLHAISKEENSLGTKKLKSDIGERAEALLRRMEDGEEGDYISPDIFSYNAVLSAYMNSATFDAAAKTQRLLQRMREKDVQPDLLSYTICINTLSKSRVNGSAQKAEDLLRLLEAEYANGCEELKPDVKCYNSGEYFSCKSIVVAIAIIFYKCTQ